MCDCSDACIVVKGWITVIGTVDANERNKKVVFKSWRIMLHLEHALIILIEIGAENIDIVMPMYSLLEYSGSYSMTSRSLWNYYRYEVNNNVNEDNDDRN